jgi:hypothetical protein
VTICHATGSDTNPYVEITVSENAVKAHRAHQHGEDVVGVTGPCPTTTPTRAQPVASGPVPDGSGPDRKSVV